MSKEKIIVFFVLMIAFPFIIGLKAQDIHYSQFLAAPYNLNPALNGSFDGDIRLIANQRMQWRSVTTPYKTFGGFVDLKNIAGNFYPGFSVFNDKAGDSRLGTFQLNISGAYSKQLDHDNRQHLIIGIQTGITQRRINYDELSFDNQYNGKQYDPGLNTGESFDRRSYMYFNLSPGLAWDFKINDRINFSSGAAIFNINKPNQSFYSRERINLDRRLTFFSKAEISINTRMDLHPSLLFMQQGAYKEYLLGSSVKYTLENAPGRYTALHGGVWLRMKDAGYALIGMDFNNVYVGLSYDFNYSNLVPASNYKGGFEVSVIYILRKFVPDRTKYRFCPSFI